MEKRRHRQLRFLIMAIKESITYVMDLVDKYTGPAQKVLKATSKIDQEFADLTKQRERAGSVKADLKAYDKLKVKLDLNAEALSEARAKANLLGREIAQTTKPTKKQIAAFDKARTSVTRLQQDQTKYRRDLALMNTQLVKAGVNTGNMALAHRKADAEVKRLTRSLDKELKTLTEISLQQAKIDKWSAKAKHIRGSVAAGDVVAAGGGIFAVKKLAQEYGEVAKAQGQLGSLGMDETDIQKVTNQARAFSNEFAGFQQSQLISATYDLKSGMSSLGGDALAGYLEISALVAGGTKASIDQITGLMATGYGIYRDGFSKFAQESIAGWEQLSEDEKDIKFGEHFGAGIAAAVQQFKTDGSQMTDAIKNIGKVAETSNVPMAEQLAILGMLQTTMSGSEAATKYKSFLNKAVPAGDKLNLSFTDQNDQLLTTVEIIQVLKTKYGETLDDMEKADLKKAFGSDEAMAYITLMYDQTAELKTSTSGLSEAMSRGRDVYGEMADKIMKGGPLESMQLMNQATKNAMADIGYGFAPIIAKLAGVIGNASNSLGNFLRENRDLAEYIAIGTTALIGLKIATVGAKFVFGGLFDLLAFGNKALLWFKTQTVLSTVALKTKSAALFLASTAQKAFNLSVNLGGKALAWWRNSSVLAAAATGLMTFGVGALSTALAILTSPITLIIAGLAALGAAGYMLYKHWDSITSWLSEKWNALADTFVSAGQWISDSLSNVFGNLVSVVLAPFKAVGSAYKWVKGLFGDDEEEAAKSIEVTRKVSTKTIAAGVAATALNSHIALASNADPELIAGSTAKASYQPRVAHELPVYTNSQIRAYSSEVSSLKGPAKNLYHSDARDLSVNKTLEVIKGGNVSTASNRGDIKIESNDKYEIVVPETNDPEMVRRVLREELQAVRREQARELRGKLYDR